MVYVLTEEGQTLYEIDAWARDSVKIAKRWMKEHGYKLLDTEITMCGNMILWTA